MSRDALPDAGPRGAGASHDEPIAVPAPAPDVALWWRRLACGPIDLARYHEWLSPTEQSRATRFGRPALRDRYVIGRATLRALLARQLGGEPARVTILRGPRGRPYVPDADGLDFNVSHTGDVALFGFTRGQRIGVDVEHEARTVNTEGIARKFMAPAEQRALARLEDADGRRRLLLRLWTCKEAMSKATGDALSAPFRAIGVAVGEGLRLVTGPAPYLPANWRLHVACVPDGHLATVALWREA